MFKKELEKLIRQSESETFEKKPSLSDINRIAEVVCSFSNGKGGKVLIGISDKSKVLGVDIGKNTIERLTDIIVDNSEPKIYPEISTPKIEGKNLILISVDSSQQSPHTAFGKAFKRAGRNTKLMSQAEYERLLLEKNKHKMQFDAFECMGPKLADVDENKVKEFLARARRERRLKMNVNMGAKEALTKLKLLKNNKLTNAAILMFGKEPQEWIIQSEVRCAKFKGTMAAKPFIDMKVIEGTIDEQIDLAEKFIMNNIKKSAWLTPGKVKRNEKWEYPLDALREAITNAICHRDYSSTSNVQVRIFDDRIEVWNPGNLPEGWTVATLKKQHESKPRNHLIAKLFFMVKNIEQWGTGTIEMIKETVKHGLPEPEFEDTGTSIVVMFKKFKLTEEILKGLNERQREAIEFLKLNKKLTTSEYQELVNKPLVTVKRDLIDLKKKKIIEYIGSLKTGYYRLVSK